MDQFLNWIAAMATALIPGLGAPAPVVWSGYVEADYVYVGAVTPGQIETMRVREGDVVVVGDILFAQTNSQQRAQLRAAEAQIAVARANLANLETGSRKEEVAVINASLAKAEADLSLANQTLERSERLFTQGLVPEAKAQQDRATYASAQAQVAQLDAQLKVAELPARVAQQAAAEASLDAAIANADAAQVALRDRVTVAPVEARVDRVFYAAGEVVGVGVPVVALFPEGALKVKFYVSETERSLLDQGQRVGVSCDGCSDGIVATITRFDSEPQNTPPIIYSRDERTRLVFMVEARLEGEATPHPGQPVSVERLP